MPAIKSASRGGGVEFRFQAHLPKVPEFKLAQFVQEVGVLQNAFAQLAVMQLRRYPPTRAGQTYVRTGMLGASWQISPPRFMGNSIETSWTNSALSHGRPYAKYVHGVVTQGNTAHQVAMHSGRWTPLNSPRTFDINSFRGFVQEITKRALE